MDMNRPVFEEGNFPKYFGKLFLNLFLKNDPLRVESVLRNQIEMQIKLH